MKHILIIDDDNFDTQVIINVLKKRYWINYVKSGLEAIKFLRLDQVDLILLDIEMPGMDGIETLKKLKLEQLIDDIPVIFLTAITDVEVENVCLGLGAHDFITKPFHGPVVLQRIHRALELQSLKKDLECQVMEKTREIEALTVQTITTFANSIDAKDSYTKSHSYHVARYAEEIGRFLGWGELDLRNLYYSALLHDIGKIGVPDSILNKPGKLTKEEYGIIQKHPEIGGRILRDISVVPSLSIGAWDHHERFDGTGYPFGKQGHHISITGRIVGIADAVDAMASDRAYRPGMPVEEVIKELERCSGHQFDPMLVEIMISILNKGLGVSKSDHNNQFLIPAINEYITSSQKDPMTGLCNFTYMETRVNMHLQYYEQKGVLVLINLDNFRNINELYNRTKGDALIILVAELIMISLGKDDFAGRMSGDEFVLYYHDLTDHKIIRAKIELLCSAIQDQIDSLKTHAKITASVGIAIAPKDGISFLSLYKNADKALYHVKQSGKNSIYFYSSED